MFLDNDWLAAIKWNKKSIMAHRIPKGLFKRHTCQRSTVIGTPKSIPELNEEHTCPPINHNSCLRLGFCFCFLSYPFFRFLLPAPLPFLINVARRVSNAFLRRGRENCRIFLEFCGAAFSQGYGVTGRQRRGGELRVSWQPLLGPVIVPKRFFVARLCAAQCQHVVGESPEPLLILFYFFSFLLLVKASL